MDRTVLLLNKVDSKKITKCQRCGKVSFDQINISDCFSFGNIHFDPKYLCSECYDIPSRCNEET